MEVNKPGRLLANLHNIIWFTDEYFIHFFVLFSSISLKSVTICIYFYSICSGYPCVPQAVSSCSVLKCSFAGFIPNGSKTGTPFFHIKPEAVIFRLSRFHGYHSRHLLWVHNLSAMPDIMLIPKWKYGRSFFPLSFSSCFTSFSEIHSNRYPILLRVCCYFFCCIYQKIMVQHLIGSIRRMFILLHVSETQSPPK